MEQLQIELLGYVKIIVSGIISLAATYATIYIKESIRLAKIKAANIKDEQAKLKVTETLTKIDDLIETNIVSAENTLKPAIVQAISDGKVDKSELNDLAKNVKENVLNQLSEDGLKIFNDCLNDTNSYLSNRIETILAKLKSNEGTAVNKTVLPEVVKNEVQVINEKLQVENEELKAKLNVITNTLNQ